MESAQVIALLWLAHAFPAAALAAPLVILGRKRVRWQAWEVAALVLPFAVWSLLMLSELAAGRKTLGNLHEAFAISLAVPLAAALRIALSRRVPDRVCAARTLAGLCAFAAMVFFAVPPLPE